MHIFFSLSVRIISRTVSHQLPQVWVSGGRVSGVLSPSLSSLGYCPQHDVLWRRITVKEHLELYSEIRGVKKQQLDKSVTEYCCS